MYKNLLYIKLDDDNSNTGGSICTKRNIETLRILFGEQHFFVFNLSKYTEKQKKNIFSFVALKVRSYMYIFGEEEMLDLNKQISDNNITHIFIDRSNLGLIPRYIKQRYGLEVMAFFHNIEISYYFNECFSSFSPSSFFNLIFMFVYEYYTCKYSDKKIVLNDRDQRLLKRIYRKDGMIIPITMKDTYLHKEKSVVVSQKKNECITLLFVGSYFYANIKGLKWFVKNVVNELPVKFVICGKRMSKMERYFKSSEKIQIYSDVEDLAAFYEDADIVVMPIFLGGGMKVKTAEAFMYGKRVLGTKEAFQGYEINSEFSIVCNCKEDFMREITHIIESNDLLIKYHKGARDLFLRKYSFESSIDYFNAALFG